MKKIYLIRHGESEGYPGNFVQAPDTPLSAKGRNQSEKIAERMADLDFDLLISSPLKRTIETAELINKKTGHDIFENDLFIERERPSRQYKLPSDSDLNKKIDEEFTDTFLRGEKYEDAESFEEVKSRVMKAFDYLDNLDQEKIVIVTHGTFSRYLAAYLLLGQDNYNLESAYRMTKVFKKTNTGVTVFQKEDIWRIYSWNDFSHFDQPHLQ